jgi:hypothetical protein
MKHFVRLKRDKILTELFNNPSFKSKILSICIRHGVPTDADIQSDILQVTFEHLTKLDPKKLFEMYDDNPNRVFGFALRIAIRNGVLADKRTDNGYRKAIATYILKDSSYYQRSDSEIDEDALIDEYNPIEYQEQELEIENESNQMWNHVRNQLSESENLLLNIMLSDTSTKIKLRGNMKQEYINLLPKLKHIITKYQNN